MRHWVVLGVVAALALALARPARADDNKVAEARARFVEGAELVKKAQWSEALVAFEQSARLRPHPITTYNIGACERALGRYTRARTALRAALAPPADAKSALPEALAEEARAFLQQIEALVVSLRLTVDPPEASVAIDGRPIEAAPTHPGAWTLTLDPGVHVFTLARQGFADVVVNRTFAPGAPAKLDLKLDRLPATLALASNRAGTVVTVDGLDVGTAPVELQRPAGGYAIQMRKQGYSTYDARLVVRPGELARLNATLEEKKTPVYKRWWFWTVAGVVVAGVGVGAYFIAKAAQTPTIDGGGLGWAVKLR